MITLVNKIQETELLNGYTQTETGEWYIGSTYYSSNGAEHTYYIRATIQSTAPSFLNLTLWQNRPRAPFAVGSQVSASTTKPTETVVSIYGGPGDAFMSYNMASLLICSDAESGVSNTITVKNCMLIDLNECFADSFEIPTKAWCDNLPFFSGSYQVQDWFNTTGGYVKTSGRLPISYKELDYIEATGTQFITTAYQPNSNTRVEAKFYMSPSQSSSWPMIFGAYNSSVGQYSSYFGNGKLYYTYGKTQTSGDNDITITASYGRLYEIVCSGNTLTANGTTATGQSNTFSIPSPLYIFDRSGSSGLFGKLKLYYFRVFESSTPIFNFVPCCRSNDNVGGLFDLISSSFYTNSGSGNFNLGSEVSDGVWKPIIASYIKTSEGWKQGSVNKIRLN